MTAKSICVSYRFRKRVLLRRASAGRLREFQTAGAFSQIPLIGRKIRKMLPAKKPAPVRMGVVAETASIADRLDRIERKLDDLVRMVTPLFGNPSVRQAIASGVTAQSLKALRQ